MTRSTASSSTSSSFCMAVLAARRGAACRLVDAEGEHCFLQASNRSFAGAGSTAAGDGGGAACCAMSAPLTNRGAGAISPAMFGDIGFAPLPFNITLVLAVIVVPTGSWCELPDESETDFWPSSLPFPFPSRIAPQLAPRAGIAAAGTTDFAFFSFVPSWAPPLSPAAVIRECAVNTGNSPLSSLSLSLVLKRSSSDVWKSGDFVLSTPLKVRAFRAFFRSSFDSSCLIFNHSLVTTTPSPAGAATELLLEPLPAAAGNAVAVAVVPLAAAVFLFSLGGFLADSRGARCWIIFRGRNASSDSESEDDVEDELSEDADDADLSVLPLVFCCSCCLLRFSAFSHSRVTFGLAGGAGGGGKSGFFSGSFFSFAFGSFPSKMDASVRPGSTTGLFISKESSPSPTISTTAPAAGSPRVSPKSRPSFSTTSNFPSSTATASTAFPPTFSPSSRSFFTRRQVE
mmetsp:Transcript_12965/g.31596  ORF Transcript_12965/g.31596 Transcript_12965/m.31596 type:complete len:457 (-) Transcript_12965:2636-4006(-)